MCFAALAVVEVFAPSVIIDLKIDGAILDLRNLHQAVLLYRSQSGAAPASLKELVASGIVQQVPSDPWGHEPILRHVGPNDGFVVYSVGADGVDQLGGGDDVITGPKKYECGVYGIDCPLPAVEWVRFVSFLGLLASTVILIGLFARHIYRQLLRRSAT
jgi:hypothetical protein